MPIDFKFESDAPGNEQFDVVSFQGHEGLSTLYRYEIELKSPDHKRADPDDMLEHTARFILDDGGPNQRIVHGILAEFQENQTTSTDIYYKAVLVPQIWNSSIYRTNEVFPGSPVITIDTIIETVLTRAGFVKDTHFDISGLIGTTFIERDYVCQFRESDIHFITRLMENEGVYFHFDQSGSVEKMIITNQATYPALPTTPSVTFDDSAGVTSQRVFNWICRKKRLPQDVSVRDFNPTQPSSDVFGSANIDDATGVGTEYLYGENFSDSTEAGDLATIRAEMLACRKTKYYSETNLPHVEPGYTFNLSNHLNTIYNSVDYLITEVTHEGSGLDNTGSGNAQYQNSVVAIKSDVQFRPELLTPKPLFHGTMTAFVYAEAAGDMAEVDASGRYRVHLPFDRATGGMQSDDPERKASAWIRMAGPYTGESEGLYFPLRGGTEVLLTFINGDPDRPIISGAVPNAANPALLNADRPTESIIQTPGGNTIRMEDDPNKVRVIIESPTADSSVRIGAPDDADELANTSSSQGVRIRTEKNLWLEAQENYGEYVKGVPADAPAPTQALLDQFGSGYNPSGLRPHTSTGNTGSTVAAAIADAHVRVAKCDTFNTQEGNIYDFGGYWNYNLGNSYTENFMDQDNTVTLNEWLTKDAAAAGGPTPGTITCESMADLDNNTWIEKTVGGASYDYAENKKSLSVEYNTEEEEQVYDKTSYAYSIGGATHEFTYGTASYEKKYAGNPSGDVTFDGSTYFKTLDASSAGGISYERKFCRNSGNLLSFSTSTQTVANSVDSMSFDWSNTATASFTFSSSASLSIEASASISLSGSLTASTSIDFSAGVSMDIKVPWICLSIDITRGGDINVELPGLSLISAEPSTIGTYPYGTKLKTIGADIKASSATSIETSIIKMFM
jgi:type VI secretion system VgrG family protein